MPNPDVNKINSLFLTKDQMEALGTLRNKLSPEDERWALEESSRIEREYGYRLTMRASMQNAFRQYWLAQGHSLQEVVDLDQMDPAEYKKNLAAFFKYIGDPERSKEENIRNIGRMRKAESTSLSQPGI